jgi:hypothetical protein
MENVNLGWEVILAWLGVLAPIVLFDLAALKWGVVTSGNRGRNTYLEV